MQVKFSIGFNMKDPSRQLLENRGFAQWYIQTASRTFMKRGGTVCVYSVYRRRANFTEAECYSENIYKRNE